MTATEITSSALTPIAPASVAVAPPEATTEVALFREAYQRRLPELLALGDDEVVQVNLDIPSAVTTALGAWPEIKAYRDKMLLLPFFDIGPVDRIEEYALTAGHAHLEYVSTSSAAAGLVEMNERATTMRELFFSDIRALIARGLLPAGEVAEYKGLVGYRIVAFELLGLVGVLRRHWAQIGGRTALEQAELDEAERLGRRMITAVGQREQGPAVVAEAAQRRARAFTLFVRAYDQARRAIGFLRWSEGDVDAIAPSLYAGRGGSRKKSEPQAPSPDARPSSPSQPAGPPAPEHPAPGLPTTDPFIG